MSAVACCFRCASPAALNRSWPKSIYSTCVLSRSCRYDRKTKISSLAIRRRSTNQPCGRCYKHSFYPVHVHLRRIVQLYPLGLYPRDYPLHARAKRAAYRTGSGYFFPFTPEICPNAANIKPQQELVSAMIAPDQLQSKAHLILAWTTPSFTPLVYFFYLDNENPTLLFLPITPFPPTLQL